MSFGLDRAPSWIAYARDALERAVRRGPASVVAVSPPPGAAHGGVFVTLRKAGRLRGCMGILDSQLPLHEAVREAAVSAALRDPRFPPVAVAELPDTSLEVSIMSAPLPLARFEDLELGRHGIIVQRGARRGLFLPQVAVEHGFDKETFLARCCTEKAGLPADAWRQAETQVRVFETTVLREGEASA